MKELESELKKALARSEPRVGFVERVEREIRLKPGPTRDTAWDSKREIRLKPDPTRDTTTVRTWDPASAGFNRLAGLTIAASLLAALVAGWQYREVQRQRDEAARGEAAKAQVVRALQIASSKLQIVQTKVKGVGS
jgi:hypothetical protein